MVFGRVNHHKVTRKRWGVFWEWRCTVESGGGGRIFGVAGGEEEERRGSG